MKKMVFKKIICWCCCVFMVTILSAQDAPTHIDTLVIELDTIREDTLRVRKLIDLAKLLKSTDLDKAAEYAKDALSLSKEIDYLYGEMMSLYGLSVIFRRQGGDENISKALEVSSKSLEIAQQLSDDEYLGNSYNSLGNIYSARGAFEESINVFLKALEVYERLGDSWGLGMINNNIGIVFKIQEKEKEAKVYFLKAIDAFSNIEGEKERRALSARAQIYMNLGNVETDKNASLSYLKKSLEIHLSLNSTYGICSANIGIGAFYLKNEEFEEALPFYLVALELAEEVGSTSRSTIAKIALTKIYLYLEQHEKALSLGKDVLDASLNTGELDLEIRIRKLLAQLYAATNDFEAATKQWGLFAELRDSIYNLEKVKISNDLEAKYQTTKTKADLAASQLETEVEKNKKNGILLMAGGVLLLGLLLVQWMVGKQRKRQQVTQIELALKEKETKQLKELDQFKSSFFTNISHELRTPLTLILSPLADILENKKSKIFHKELSLVQSSARNLHNLVNEIMDLSKVEAGKLELQESRVAISETTKRMFSSFESMAKLHRVNYILDNQLTNVDVQLDREKFEKIINNLLSNALKFTGEGGMVEMKAYKQAENYVFEIEDNGKGIHSDDLAHVFDRFYQAKKTSGIEQGGTGVGLALSKEFAQLLSGTLSVKSEWGKGSVFVLKLPLKELSQSDTPTVENIETPEVTEAPSIYVPFMVNGQKPKILIVEDNREMGQYLLQVLSDHYQCVLATDGIEAIRQLEIQTFDCITSDVMMPNMDGFELRDQINQNAQWRQIPFILLTARYLEEDILRGFKLGIDDYVTKPFSTRELKARIHNMVHNKMERDTFKLEEQKLPQDQQVNVDDEWIRQVEQEVLENLDNPQFNVNLLGKAVGYSGKQLGRLIKKQTGLTTVNFILEIRLQKARELLERRQCPNVTAAYMEVGLSSMSYFTRKFTERFGKNPKDVLAGI